MKLYGIACRGELPRLSLLLAAKQIARDQLSKEKVNNYGVGFIGVHDGRDAAFVFVDFWGNENEKHVLRMPDAPDFDGYLAERLREDA